MATLGALVVKLTANSSNFTKNMKRARGPLAKFKTAVRGTVTSLAKMGAAMTAVAAGALTIMVKRQLQAIDTMQKLGLRTGATVATIQRLRFAAGLAGVSVAGMDKALEQFTRRIGDALGGTGEYADAIAKLGLSSEFLATATPNEAFLAAADAIAALTTQAERADAAYQLFGRQGIALLPLLQQGSAAIKAQGKEFDSFGGTLTNIESNKIAAFNDAMLRLNSVFTAFASGLTVAVAPALVGVADAIKSAIVNAGGMKRAVQSLVRVVATGIGFASSVLESFKLIWKGLQIAASEFMSTVFVVLDNLITSMNRVLEFFGLEGLDKLESGFDAMVDAQRDTTDQLAEEFQVSFDRIAQGIPQKEVADKLAQWEKAAEEAAQKMESETGRATNGVKNVADAAAKSMDKLKAKAKQIFDATRTPIERFKSKVGEIKKLFAEGLIDSDTFQRAIDKAKDAITGGFEKLTATSGPTSFLSAITAGSAQASRAKFGSEQAQTLTVSRQQLAMQRSMVRKLDDLIQAVNEDGETVVEFGTPV